METLSLVDCQLNEGNIYSIRTNTTNRHETDDAVNNFSTIKSLSLNVNINQSEQTDQICATVENIASYIKDHKVKTGDFRRIKIPYRQSVHEIAMY